MWKAVKKYFKLLVYKVFYAHILVFYTLFCLSGMLIGDLMIRVTEYVYRWW